MRLVAVVVGVLLVSVPSARGGAPPSPDAMRALALLDAGDVAEARRLAEPLAAAAAPDALALQTLGRIARREGRVDAAVMLLEAAVAADPRRSEACVHLCGAYIDKLRSVGMLQQLDWARKLRLVAQKAVDLDADNCDAQRVLTEFYLQAPRIAGGSPERARSEAARFRDRCAARGHLAFALAAQTVGDLPGAESACVAALRADPGRGEGFALLGWIERLEGIEASAPPTAGCRDLLAAAPSWHQALYEAGRAGVLPGATIEKAESGLRATVRRERAPESKARLRWALGLAHQIRGDGDAAWREFTGALALAPGMDLAVRGRDSLRQATELPAPTVVVTTSADGGMPEPDPADETVRLLGEKVVPIPDSLIAPALVGRTGAPPLVVAFERPSPSVTSGPLDLVELELRDDRLVEVRRVRGLLRSESALPQVRPPTLASESSLLPLVSAGTDGIVLVPLSGDAPARVPLPLASPVAVQAEGRPVLIGFIESGTAAPAGARIDAPAGTAARYDAWVVAADPETTSHALPMASAAEVGDEAADALDGLVASDGVLHLVSLGVERGRGMTRVEHLSFHLNEARWLRRELILATPFALSGRPWIVETAPGTLDVVWSQAGATPAARTGLFARRIGEARVFHLTPADSVIGLLPAEKGGSDLVLASVEEERIEWFRRRGPGWQHLGATAGGPGVAQREPLAALSKRALPVWRMGRGTVGIAFFKGRSIVALRIRMP